MRHRSWRLGTGLVLALAGLAAASGFASSATAKVSAGLYVTGAGYGHGVGMSQYGAAGYAEHGYSYRQILQKYYARTTLGNVDPGQMVTVLLKPSGSAAFSGAVNVRDSKIKLVPSVTYSVARAGAKLRLMALGRTVGKLTPPLVVSGPDPVTLVGLGAYRGSFVFRPSAAGGVMTVNSVSLDDYVQGVVTSEMPSSWPQQALEAQAVAARTFAITTARGPDFELYDDATRSESYDGVKGETPSGNAAVAATSGQVVEYAGKPVTTFFFSSSGGQTESVQNVFGGAPEPWLVGEPDPYDDSYGNDHYRWTIDLSLGAAEAKLGSLVDGQLEAIKIIKHGVSPRIVEARIVGTKGTTTATGIQLRTALSAPSTWMAFTTVSAKGVRTTSTVSQGVVTTTTESTTKTETSTTKTQTTKTQTSATRTQTGKGGNGGASVTARARGTVKVR